MNPNVLSMNVAEWMSHPDRPCASGAYATQDEVNAHAERWFPTDTSATPQAARKLCRGCPVQTECLTWALENKEAGIWGGTTEPQRARARTKAGAA